jgi:hypothetical protein
MTPRTPSSSEGSSLPPRSRPNLGDFVKANDENDLWAFDDVDLEADLTKVSQPVRPLPSKIPAPRESRFKAPEAEVSVPLLKPERPLERTPERPVEKIQNSVRVDIGKASGKPQLPIVPLAEVEDNSLGELEDWDHLEPEILPLDELATEEAAPEPPMIAQVETVAAVYDRRNDTAENLAPTHPPQVEAPAELATPVVSPQIDEFSPPPREGATPMSLVPRLGLNGIEKAGLFTLLGTMVILAGWIFIVASGRLPTENQSARTGVFPMKGAYTEIFSAKTFWREPIRDGAHADTFQRGMVLLPVVSLSSSGGNAALRVLFRDANGAVKGDAVTVVLQPNLPVEVVGTSGFEDVGLHAAYRTGQTKPWTVEVREAPSATSTTADFKKLLEIEVSTDLR